MLWIDNGRITSLFLLDERCTTPDIPLRHDGVLPSSSHVDRAPCMLILRFSPAEEEHRAV